MLKLYSRKRDDQIMPPKIRQQSSDGPPIWHSIVLTVVVEKEAQLRDYVASYLSAPLAQDAVPAFQPPASASGRAAAAQLPAAAAADPAAQPGGNSSAGGDSSDVGRIAEEGLTGLVGADSAVFSGLTRPVALVSAVVAGAAVLCIAWSRSGRV